MKHQNFPEFKATAMIIVHFVDKMSIDGVDEMLQDWYELYKGMKYYDVIEFFQFHLNPSEVNRDTHDFWLDDRGLYLMHVAKNVHC